MSQKQYQLSPIGHVRADAAGFRLELDPRYAPALHGVQGFSHLNVLWWCHRCDEPALRQLTECEQPYRDAPPTLGLFATRSPVRPNPIALTTVAILGVDEAQGIVHVPYMDAEDGTPILDLKPYHPSADRVREVRVPGWCRDWPQWYEDSADFDWSAVFIMAR